MATFQGFVAVNKGVRSRWFKQAAPVTLLAVTLGAAVLGPVQAQTRPAVPVVAVGTRAVGQGFDLDGVVQPVTQSTVSAQASGRIVALLVKAGDRVRAGQVLATIDDQETQTVAKRSQAALAQTQADLRNTQANFDRTRDLHTRGFVSVAALDAASAQLASSRAVLDQAQSGVQQAGLAQGFTRVTAPFDAFVLQTQSQVGDLAVPGKPLLTLYAPQPLRVVVQVPVSRAALMPADGAVQMLLPTPGSSPQWTQPAAVTRLPSVDAVSQTAEWRLDLASASARAVSPGLKVPVRFATGLQSRLMLPAAAILRRGELTAVYVATGFGFALKAVRLGSDHGVDGLEVLAGVAVGDRVALDPVRAGLLGAQAIE